MIIEGEYMSIQATIAVNRFGLGARPNELAQASADPQQWLIKHLMQKPPVIFDDELPHSNEISKTLALLKMQEREEIKRAGKVSTTKSNKNNAKEKSKKYNRSLLQQFSASTVNNAISSPHSLNWRLLDFFSNHFSVSANGAFLAAMSPTLEREAIAPNLFGQFEDMLLAVTKHPAMLLYLNNEKSFGPDSRLGKKGKGLNENLAREILELHTLGVNGGYSQTDVTELAKGITGWSIANPRKDEEQGFIFRKIGHQPGPRRLLGKKYPMWGLEQGEAMLKNIARHPSTAKHLCYKLAHHFISDNPPQTLVDKLIKRWHDTKGNIKEVMITLIKAQESWQPQAAKYKTPREFFISSFRAIGANNIDTKNVFNSLLMLGQQPFNAGSPAGYGDDQSDWNGASALISRVEWASALSSRVKANAESIMKSTLGEHVSQRTYKSVLRAESRKQAFTLLLMSPEFLRR